MARTLHKLTPDRLKQKSKKVGVYADGGGLYLCVKRAASKDAGGLGVVAVSLRIGLERERERQTLSCGPRDGAWGL